MKFSHSLICLYGLTATASAAALPDTSALSIRSSISQLKSHYWPDLHRRKGGGGSSGGGGGRGGSSGSTSSSGSSGSSSGSSGTSSGGTSSGGSGASSGRGSSSSSLGGQTTTGSGAPRSYGGGAYYGGGARVPYTAGARSPAGIVPFLILTPALALGAVWAYGAYAYPYSHPYSFYNSSRRANETLPVQCWCQQYEVCGCDDNQNSTYLNSVIGNGTNLNDTLVRRANLNGTDTIVINGTLANGTTASGGTESPDDSTDGTGTGTTTTTSGAAGLKLNGWASLPGYWMMLVTVTGIVCTM